MHLRFLDAVISRYSDHPSVKPLCIATSASPSPTTSPESERSAASSDGDDEFGFHLDQSPLEVPDPIDGDVSSIDDTELAALVARYGHAPATAWLERTRYRIWRPAEAVPPSSFVPVQGYLHAKDWVFAWGAPLVSDAAALEPTVAQFIAWARSHSLRVVYCCVPEEIEGMLGDMGWSTVGCISEDVIDPQHVLELTREDDEGGHGSKVKDLKKNLRRAARAYVEIERIWRKDWSDELKRKVEDGIDAWQRARKGYQLAATSFDPWLDFENRKYWLALQHGRMIGILILTPAGDSYAIKNAAQFPDAPKGTSERLIHTMLRDIQEQHFEEVGDHFPGRLTVTFNLSAASDLNPYRNISGWKFEWLNQLYKRIARVAQLMNRHDFRRKFDTFSRQMFVCYPSEDGFGREGIDELLKLLRR